MMGNFINSWFLAVCGRGRCWCAAQVAARYGPENSIGSHPFGPDAIFSFSGPGLVTEKPRP